MWSHQGEPMSDTIGRLEPLVAKTLRWTGMGVVSSPRPSRIRSLYLT